MLKQIPTNIHTKLAALAIFGLMIAACGTPAAPTANEEAAPAPTATLEAESDVEATGAEVDKAGDTAEEPVDVEATPSRTETFVIVPEETEASYTIDEVFINQNNALVTAVGVTSNIEGEFSLNYDDPPASEFGQFVVDVSTLKSDRSRRDRAIRSRWLESSTFPLATFEIKEVRGFPTDPQEGQAISFQLVGDMTVKETTNEVVWDLTAILEGDRLTGTATLATFLADFNIPIPNIANILKVTDGILLTLDFTFERVPSS